VLFLAIAVSTAAGMTADLIPPFFLDCVVAIGYRPLMAVTGPDGKPQPHGGFYSDRIWFSLRAFL